jgi:thymidylate synthase ThyX
MDRMFDSYSQLAEIVTNHVRETVPKVAGDSDFIYRQATRAKALDAVRGALPSASLSNVGIYGSGQAFEQLLLRMRAHPLPESRLYADMMLTELRKVIPSFLRRVDIADRGGKWSEYLSTNTANMNSIVDEIFGSSIANDVDEVSLVDFDPDGENKLVAAACYQYSHLPESQIIAKVEKMTTAEKTQILTAYIGNRDNRRHRPGRAFERIDYRFDVLSDYGAFRDLQRHRLLTIEWQPLTPYHGYTRPDLVDTAGAADMFDEVMDRSSSLYETLVADYPNQAAYAVSMAYRIRYNMQFNAREAMHMLELRSSPQGHPSYRRVALEMHRLIAEKAGHHAVADAMTHMTQEAPELERLESERRAESRRNAKS